MVEFGAGKATGHGSLLLPRRRTRDSPERPNQRAYRPRSFCRLGEGSVMSIHVALLRGINVGGRRQVAMSDLRNLFEALGFAGAKSLLQSGNLVFESEGRTGVELERLLEIETTRRLD